MAISITPSPFGSVTVTLDGELGGVLSVGVLATSNSALNMDLGVPGPQGEAGEPGANGQNGEGVPVGGSAGQVLAKIDGTDYNTEWVNAGAAGDYLPLAGGTMTGDITFSVDGNGNDSLLGSFGFGVENTNGQVAYIQPDVFRIYDSTYTTGTSINGEGITFNDSTVQTTAGLPLTGGTMTGSVTLSQAESNLQLNVYDGYGSHTDIYGGEIQLLNDNNSSALYLFSDRIEFPNNSIQTTAFPGYTGTTAQYIDGTGALQTFPTVTTAGKMVTLVRNNSGATITKGTVVYINGAVGNKPTIAKAQANSEATSKATFAFVEADIANNADGNVVQIGLLENIDTQGFTDGTQIFLSPTTAGGWTSTQPFSPYHYVRLGTVIRGGHPTQGSIAVNIINGFQLDEMSDVGAISPTNNNVLTWVSASSQWLDKSISTILGYTPANGTDYLAKADNLSGLASTSTARTNLGLGAVATDAYATTAQAQAGTSTTTVVSPATLLDARYLAGARFIGYVTATGATSGTGASATTGFIKAVNAPTTAIGFAQSYFAPQNSQRGEIYNTGIDFRKNIVFGGRFCRLQSGTVDSNSIFRCLLGRGVPLTTAGDLSSRGVGIRLVGNTGALELQVYNGTSLFNVTSSFTPVYNQAFDVVITSNGAGVAKLYVNGTSVATSSNAPTTLLTANVSVLLVECQNTAILTNSPMQMNCSDQFLHISPV